MCVGEQAPKSSKYDFSKIYIQNYKNQKFLGRVRWVRWVRWVRQLVEAVVGASKNQFASKIKPRNSRERKIGGCIYTNKDGKIACWDIFFEPMVYVKFESTFFFGSVWSYTSKFV